MGLRIRDGGHKWSILRSTEFNPLRIPISCDGKGEGEGEVRGDYRMREVPEEKILR
jgi:hypothetical protein